MRILIVSDTHGRHDKFDKALEKAGKIDLMIHLGDIQDEEDYMEIASGCPVCMLRETTTISQSFLMKEQK